MTALIFFVSAVSHAVYDMTTPHVPIVAILVRKAYSIGAFAIIAFCYARSRTAAATAETMGVLAIYSGVIEVAQFFHGSKEGLGWNAVDVACGAIGGAIGAAAAGRLFTAETTSPGASSGR